MAFTAEAETVLSNLPQTLRCPAAAYDFVAPSHYARLDILMVGASSAEVELVPDMLMGAPRDQWTRWRADVREAPHYWEFIPLTPGGVTIFVFKRLTRPAVALARLDPPLFAEPFIGCWFREQRE